MKRWSAFRLERTNWEARKSVTGVTSNPDFAERGLGQEPQALGTFRVARVVDEGNEEERKKSYTATRTECYPPPPNPPKFSRGKLASVVYVEGGGCFASSFLPFCRTFGVAVDDPPDRRRHEQYFLDREGTSATSQCNIRTLIA